MDNLSRRQKMSALSQLLIISSVIYLAESTAPSIVFFSLNSNSQSSVDVTEGSRLVCVPSVSGDPQPTITFYKDGQVDPQATDTTLIKTIQRSDEGLYWIVANNSEGAAISQKIRLSIYFINPWTDSGDVETKNVQEGAALVLNVPHIEANPQPDETSLEWYTGATPADSNNLPTKINRDADYHITSSMQLILLSTPIWFDTDKMFQAQYSNFYALPIQQTRSKRFQLHVVERAGTVDPEFVISLPPVSYAQRTSGGHVLECVINAKPLSSYEIAWYRQLAGSNTRERITTSLTYTNRRCTINNFNDGDVYICEAGSDATLISSSTTISVVEAPSFEQRLSLVQNVDLGSKINLQCQVKSNPPANITWYKNAVPIIPSNRLIVHSNGSLTLLNIQFTDTALYQCVAENIAGSVTDQTHVKLNSAPPSITHPPQNQTLLSGETALLSCVVAGEPRPDVYWTFGPSFGGGSVELTNTARLTVTNTSVRITSVVWSDGGSYQCKANNSLGVKQASGHLTVYNQTSIIHGQFPLEERKSALVNRTCILNKDSRVSAQILWYHNDNLIVADSYRKLLNNNQTLSFNPIRSLSDDGRFMCRVFSVAGNDSWSYDITIIEVPLPVEAQATLVSEPRAINITWRAPDDGNRPILKYKIVYRENSTSTSYVLLADDIPPSDRSFIARNRKPARTYEFAVSAFNSLGPSQIVYPTTPVRVPPEAPSAAPSIVSLSATSSRSVNVRFSAPPREDWNSESLSGYKIQHGIALETLNTLDVTAITLSADINNLLAYTEYWVRVAAYNEVPAEPLYSTKQLITTKEETPEKAPDIQSIVGVSSTECSLQWIRPDIRYTKGRALGYYVRAYKDGGDELSVTKTVSPLQQDLQSTVLGTLGKYTNYRVTVSVYNSAGESPVDTANCTTLEDTPEAIRELKVDIYTHDSISVVWRPPTVSNGILKNYTVSISEPGKIGSEKVYSTPLTNYTVSGLEANTDYRIEVSATTSVGAGPSKPVLVTTRPPPERPQKPTRLEVSNVESRSVLIRFQPGSDGQAPVTEWIVESRQADSSSWQVIAHITDPGSRLTEFTVDGLQPYQKYIFRIKARNIEGDSEASNPTEEITTLMTAPESPPANVTVRAQNNFTLIINWEPLDLASFNGEDPSYRVVYKSEYEGEDVAWHSINVSNPKSRFYVLDKLNAYTTYRVEVISVNSAYASTASNVTSARTIEYVPSVGPTISRNGTLGHNVEFFWDPIPAHKANGIVQGYKVLYTVSDSRERTQTQITTDKGIIVYGLRAYTAYDFQVLAFTRMGDGVPSPTFQITTIKDKPSVPRSFGMQSIQSSSLRLTWLQPEHFNSPPPISYTLKYKKTDNSDPDTTIPDINEFYHEVTGLDFGSRYRFELVAVNTEGASDPVTIIYTVSSTSTHDVPASPRDFRVYATTSINITLKWARADDNGLPITNYTLWYRPESGAYMKVSVFIAGDAERYTMEGLFPNTKYYFKLAAVNDKGQSGVTIERWNTTSSERPSLPPTDLEVVPKTATSLNITWTHPPSSSRHGNLISTRIWYRTYDSQAKEELSDFDFEDVSYPDSTVMLDSLQPLNLYEIKLGSVNGVGHSDPGLPLVIYVGIAVPVGAPSSIGSGEISGQTITVTWKHILGDESNGQLLGYKVYYDVVGVPPSRRKRAAVDSRQYDLVGPEKTSHTLTNLVTYKQYLITVTAYNIAGEGPSSQPILAITDQGVPGKVGNLSVTEVTLERANVTWDTPAEPNGVILEYEVTYTRINASDSGYSSTQHVSHPTTFVELSNIPKNSTFNFSVVAKTKKGKGETIVTTYITGPRPGAPSAPEMAQFSNEENGILVKWTVSSSGRSDIQGYVVEGLNNVWQLVVRELDSDAVKALLTADMLPKDQTFSRYRVSLFNSHGLGDAMEAREVIPYYKTWWFLVIIALSALVIIIIITAVLCCYCYRMRAKLAEEAYEQDVIGADGYNTYEMRQSIKRENRGGSKYRAQPPRPSPSAVQYATEDVPPRYDDSSITEKGDVSSDDEDAKGNGSVTDSSDDDIDKGGASSVAPSYNNYQYGGYNPYVQSGAVQQSWQNSFGRGRNQPNMYAYTDSEAESSRATSTSHYRRTNGLVNHSTSSRQHLVNDSPDLPGSRAPLPGFSSFV